MAQHIEIEKFPQKIFKTIEASIKKDFNSAKYTIPFLTSFKYIYDNSLQASQRIDENDLFYSCERYIGKGFVWGSERGYFEIHFDKINRLVTKIYFVA